MKLPNHFKPVGRNVPIAPQLGRASPHRAGERGMAVIVVLAFLAILFIYLAANIRTLRHLEKEIRLLELKQTHRLQVISNQLLNPQPSPPVRSNDAPKALSPEPAF